MEVRPGGEAQPVERLTRGLRVSIKATGLVSNLSRSIAERELKVLKSRLSLADDEAEVLSVPEPVGPGNAIIVELRYEHITEVFAAFGSPGKGAEDVARELADEVREYIAGGFPVGPHLADQVMVPLAVLAGGRFATGPLTAHARTNIDVIRAFGGSVEVGADGIAEVRGLARG